MARVTVLYSFSAGDARPRTLRQDTNSGRIFSLRYLSTSTGYLENLLFSGREKREPSSTYLPLVFHWCGITTEGFSRDDRTNVKFTTSSGLDVAGDLSSVSLLMTFLQFQNQNFCSRVRRQIGPCTLLHWHCREHTTTTTTYMPTRYG